MTVTKLALMTSVEVKPEMICNAFIGAFEGGSNYWLQTAELVFAENKPDPARKLVWWGHENLYEAHFTFRVGYDDPSEDEGAGNGSKLISYPEDVLAGSRSWRRNSPITSATS